MKYLLAVILSSFGILAYSQTTFTSVGAGGAWNAGPTWGGAVCSPCVAGTNYPGPNDVAIIAVTSGNSVSFPRLGSPAFACKDLYVVSNVAGSLRSTGISGSPTLTISGNLAGVNVALSDYQEPSVDVFQSTMSNVDMIFTGTNLDDPTGPVIQSWGFLSPLYRISLSPASQLKLNSFALRNSCQVTSGTVDINSGESVSDAAAAAIFTVRNGAALNVFGGINGSQGDATAMFNRVTVETNATISTGNLGYFNASNFTLSASATLNVGFNNGNQLNGWWYQSSGPPTSLTIDAASTVSYLSNSTQNVYATTYGNLTLSSTTPVVKTLVGSGLTILGNLSINSNVTFSPTTIVEFLGSSTQSIAGAGSLNFDGGLELNKSGGSVTLNKAVSIDGGISILAGTLDLGNVQTTLASGNISNGGSITSGTAGSLVISGTTTSSGAGTLQLNDVIINGSVNFNNSAIGFTGDITNNGSISFPSTSTVSFTGGASQIISGNSFSVGNMVVNKTSSTLSNNGNVELLGVLTVNTGTFDADGSGSGIFTLNSDANADASIGPMAGGIITGEVTFERYFNNTNKRWRNIAFPVTSVDYSELSSSFQVSPSSISSYVESTMGDVNQGWVVTPSGSTLNSRTGYSAYMFNTTPITITVRGPLLQNQPSTNVSPYDFQVTYTNDASQPATENGWNFVPNPYAAPINWNNGGWTKNGSVNAAAAVWDAQSASYKYSNVGWDGVVAQGQGFWVQTNAAGPVLTSTEAVKTSVADPSFYRTAAPTSRLLVTLKDAVNTDVAAIQFKDEATAGFDPAFDAYKLKNEIFNLSSLAPDGTNLAANTLPVSGCLSSVKLNINNINAGTYRLSFDGISSFLAVDSIQLIDNFLHTSLQLKGSEVYSFAVTSDAKSFGKDRFEVKFYFQNNGSAVSLVENEGILVSSTAKNEWYLNDQLISGYAGQTYQPVQPGEYYVKTIQGGCSFKSDKVIVSPSIEQTEGSIGAYPNPVESSSDLSVRVNSGKAAGNHGKIVIQAGSGSFVKTDNFTSTDVLKTISMKDVSPGLYILTISDSSGRVNTSKLIVR